MTDIKYLSLLYINARDLVHHQFECEVVPVICRSSISKIQQSDSSLRVCCSDENC